MTERSQNVRSVGTRSIAIERNHNSRRHDAESRRDEPQSSARSYRGSHRAEHLHRAEHHVHRGEYLHRAEDRHTAAYDRSSRVGRHHADRQPDHSNRW